MAERGHDVHLITMHRPDKDKIDDRVNVYFLPLNPSMGYYLNVFKVRKLLNKIKPDILNTHYASGYGTLSRLVNYYPTLLSVWGSDVFDFPYRSKINKKILKKNLKAATQIASTSFAMKKQTEKFVSPKLPIVVTPFGVDMNLFKPSHNGKERDTITIGIVKRLEEVYGIEYLIKATSLLIKKLRENRLDDIANRIRLLIVGEGSLLDKLQNLTRDYGISHITKFVGAVPNVKVPEYLNKMDIFCVPSLQESFGVAAVEASACELPVIVSNVGGLPEVVKDGETGFIVEPKNIQQLADRLYDLVINPELRMRLGKNGRNFVNSFYNWEENVERMETVYENLIKMK
ncbi:glycosyltransferase [Anoxybacillus kestanbolensis]|nr:glycosyltransferase [Anoxybacillus kestanbolensis]